MADHLSQERRHANMAAIHAKDTKPELIVRKYLWRQGYRYRLNHPRLPGKPDIVLRKYHTCIFVNGCFWHGHEGCRYYTTPKSNTHFWVSKVRRNRQRDAEVKARLSQMGWYSITVWECELKPDKREATLASLSYTLNQIFLRAHSLRRYRVLQEEASVMAAEDTDNSYGKPSQS